MTTDTIIQAYPYQQFSDDQDICALFDAYNQYAQQYLDWFNQTPLAIYTNSNISGPFLDWIGQGIYGVIRAPIGSFSSNSIGPLNTYTPNQLTLNTVKKKTNSTSSYMTDDIYRRLITWDFYKGDGMQLSIPWMKKRIARFVFGESSPEWTRRVSIKVVAGRVINIFITAADGQSPIVVALNSIITQQICNWPIGYTATVTFIDDVITSDDFGGDIA